MDWLFDATTDTCSPGAAELRPVPPLGWDDGSIVERPGVDASSAWGCSNRVCDRCILKKVKCDLKRPACARCIESGWPCVYSSVKRKPGPTKGTRRVRKIANRALTSSRCSVPRPRTPSLGLPDSPVNFLQFDLSADQDLSGQNDSLERGISSAHDSYPGGLALEASATLHKHRGLAHHRLSCDKEKDLLHDFFKHIAPSVPLFQPSKILQHYDAGSLDRSLLLTMVGVTAKILRVPVVWSDDAEAVVGHLLDLNNEPEDGDACVVLDLDSFRQSCLAAFYAFHQQPGPKSWGRIGQLTRRAYRCGLHQLDNHDQGSVGLIDADELEEWRHIWWFIYCLDSYSNIMASTPFLIEEESVCTALAEIPPPTPMARSTSECEASRFLHIGGAPLWQTAKAVVDAKGRTSNHNMHIITTALLREASSVSRLQKQSSSPSRLRARHAAFQDHLAAVRLALPARYLNPGRNVMQGESSDEQHSRLVCLLHLHGARTMAALISLEACPEGGAEWWNQWERSLEYVEDVVAVVHQWDTQFCTAVDPAVCFILAGALMMLHLHQHCRPNQENEEWMQTNKHLAMAKDILMLLLRHFADSWDLPHLLISVIGEFTALVSRPLTPADTRRILKLSPWSRFQGRDLHSPLLVALGAGENSKSTDDVDGNAHNETHSQRSHIDEWDIGIWEAIFEGPR